MSRQSGETLRGKSTGLVGIMGSPVHRALPLSKPFSFIPSEENGTPEREKELQKVEGLAGTGSAVPRQPRLGPLLGTVERYAAGVAGARPEET